MQLLYNSLSPPPSPSYLLAITVQFSIYHDAPQQQRERNMQKLYLRSVDDNKQAPPLSQRPGYWEAKEQLRNLQMEKREQLDLLSLK